MAGGRGAVAIYNLMEDTATAEICRSQLWQWVHHRAALAGGGQVTPELYHALSQEESAREAEGYTATRHQREAGTDYFDLVALAVSGGSASTTAMAGSTEAHQFH